MSDYDQPSWSIVVLDDSLVNRTVCCQLVILAMPGASIASFAEPQEALAWLRNNEPDLVITDFKMGAMDGAEFISRLRKQAADASVPVVVLTAFDDRESKGRALRAGANDFLITPISDHDEFAARVSNLARLGRQQRLLRRRASELADKLGESEASRRRAVRESTMRLAQVIDSIPAMIYATGEDGVRIFANPLAAAADTPSNDTAQEYAILDQRVLETGEPVPEYIHVERDSSGAERSRLTSKVPLHDEAGRVTAVLTTSLDITARQRAEARLREFSRKDLVTGIANKAYFLSCLGKAVARGRRGDFSFALHYVDLDWFKRVNDGYGHHVGDALLKEVASRLAKVAGERGLMGRLGGDEFGVLQCGSHEVSATDAACLANDMLRALASPAAIEGTTLHPTASIGIVLYPWDGSTPDQLLGNADIAMFRAKDGGRNQFKFCEGLEEETAEKTADEIRQALIKEQFCFCFQRQFEVHSGVVVGAEALLRWRRPRGNLLPPSTFLYAVEHSDCALPLASWVLEAACSQLSCWQFSGSGPRRLAVNVSPAHSRCGHLVSDVAAIIQMFGIDPNALILEFSECMLDNAPPAMLDQLVPLSKLGVRLCIDGYGVTGVGPSVVRRYPITTIRIDQSIVQSLRLDDEADDVVRKAVSLGRIHNLEVAAVGVERPEQLELLRDAGVAVLQGNFLERPISAEVAEIQQAPVAGAVLALAAR